MSLRSLPRDIDDDHLAELLESAWKDSRESYGEPRLVPEVNERLAAAGSSVRLGNRWARKLMGRKGIVGQSRRRWRQGCTRRNPKARPAPDLLNRSFTAPHRDAVWVSDITQIDTLDGPVWAAVVTDVWSRRIVGWSIAGHHRDEVVTTALDMAVSRRRHRRQADMIILGLMSNTELSDRIEIADCLARYCHAVDRYDREMLLAVWHPDGTADYGAELYQGSSEGLVDWLWKRHESTVARSHQVTNILIELDGDKARSDSYATVALRVAPDGGDVVDSVSRARYSDTWSRREDRWAIDHRQLTIDMSNT